MLSGLLGTVSGLITSFGAVSAKSVDPSQKATILDAGISEAMNCTAFGLGVAIIGLRDRTVLDRIPLGAGDEPEALALLLSCAPYLNADPYRTDRLMENLANMVRGGAIDEPALRTLVEDRLGHDEGRPLLLLLLQFAIVRFGLLPLGRLADRVARNCSVVM